MTFLADRRLPVGRVLIIGASGQVGRQLLAELARRHEHLDVVAASRSDPDPAHRVELEHAETVERLIVGVRPDHVILAAGATNVAWCEAEPAASRTINVLGTAAAAAAAKTIDATLTFISTDYVFDGTDGPNGEDDPTNPINAYGADKLAAETVVMAANPANLVVRTCQVFGDDPRRTNFVLRVADRLRRGETVEAAGDLFGTPTYAPDLGRALIELTLTRASGIWHVAGERFLSRYELATTVAAAFGCVSGAIVEVSADQMDDPVNRPRRAGLRTPRLDVVDLRLITPLQLALADLAAKEMSR